MVTHSDRARHVRERKTRGIDPAQTFFDLPAHRMRRQPPW